MVSRTRGRLRSSTCDGNHRSQLPEPVRGDDPFGLRWLGGDVRLPHAVQRGSPRLRGGELLVPGRRARARALLPVRLRRGRLRRHRLQPGEHPPVRRAPVARRRVPDPQRLRLHQRRTRSPTSDARSSGRSCSRGGRPLLRALGRALRALAREGRGGDPRARGARVPSCPSSRTKPSSPRAAASARATTCSSPTTACSRDSTASWQYHFELLNLGYGAYLVFYELCRQAFPDITTRRSRRWSRASTSSSCARTRSSSASPGSPRARRRRRRRGRRRRGRRSRGARRERRRARGGSPTTRRRRTRGSTSRTGTASTTTTAPGSTTRRCRSRPSAPTSSGSRRVRTSRAPYDAIVAERERITAEYRALLAEDDAAAVRREPRRSPAPSTRSSRTTTSTSSTATTRSSGTRCASSARYSNGTDSWPTRRTSSTCATTRSARHSKSSGSGWSSGGAGAARGPGYWPPIVERRKSIYKAMREWTPPPALGRVPEAITDPITVMLWGITDERIQEWLSSQDGADSRTLSGTAPARPAWPRAARVILTPDQLGELEQGEILVAPSTSPSWTPVFGRIAGCRPRHRRHHVPRGHRRPRVRAAGRDRHRPATKRIKTGDRLRVDADAGVVTILA